MSGLGFRKCPVGGVKALDLGLRFGVSLVADGWGGVGLMGGLGLTVEGYGGISGLRVWRVGV